jgi:serine protease Do
MEGVRSKGTLKILFFVLMGVLVGLVLSARTDLTERIEAIFGGGEKEAVTEAVGAAGSGGETHATAERGDMICLPDFTTLAEKLDPAVGNISTTQVVKGSQMGQEFGFRHPGPGSPFGGPQQPDPFEEFFDRFFRGGPFGDMKRRSLGSGFVIDEDGYILTNHHVVKDAETITVTFYDETETGAKVIGKDPKTDLALIKVDVDKKLPTARLGNSDGLRMGDWVLAIGNPFGLKYTLTAGIVSAKGREIGAGPYDDFIQTDASINPGNSGGPLINMKGEVVGINTAIIAGGTGIGFAIPINVATGLLPQLKDKGRVSRGWLGVYIQRVTPDLAQSFGLEKPKGALVSEVTKGGPADGSGLEHGDIIVELDGKPVDQFNDLPRMVASTAPGEKVTLKVLRNGKEKTIKVTLGELPDEEAALVEGESGQELGLQLQEVTPDLARTHELPSDKGLIVTDLDPNGVAADAGIRRGDIITEVNQKPVRTISEFQKKVGEAKEGEMMLFLIKRKEGSLYIAVEKK